MMFVYYLCNHRSHRCFMTLYAWPIYLQTQKCLIKNYGENDLLFTLGIKSTRAPITPQLKTDITLLIQNFLMLHVLAFFIASVLCSAAVVAGNIINWMQLRSYTCDMFYIHPGILRLTYLFSGQFLEHI